MKFSDVQLLPDDTILGIDEVGRGPVLGPMIMACVLINASQLNEIIATGAKDSKKCSEIQRKSIFKQIKNLVKWDMCIISPYEIDTCPMGLNILEMEHVVSFVKKYSPKYLIIDNPYSPESDFNLANFIYQHGVKMDGRHCFAENKADDLYPVVSAASIVAKESRERAMKALMEQYQIDCGSGYPSDPKTKKFLVENWQDVRYNSFIRHSWATYKRLANKE